MLQTLEGHTYQVTSVAFSPDSTQVVSGSANATVRLWDTATGIELQKLEGHFALVNSVAFSPDSKQVVSGSADKTVNSVAFSPDSMQVVSGSDDTTVRLWDTTTGTALQTLEGHTDWVRSVAFSLDGTQVVSGSADATVRLWDAATGTALQTLKGYSSSVTLVPFSQDSNLLPTLRVFNSWIIEGDTDIVWLPPNYRETCLATWNSSFVTGHKNGSIYFYKFTEGEKFIS